LARGSEVVNPWEIRCGRRIDAGLGAKFKIKRRVAPLGLAFGSDGYPGLPPGAQLFRPSGSNLKMWRANRLGKARGKAAA
jgi:hypothetical protein